MVLQREIKNPIWGWAAPGEEVTVSVQDQTLRTHAADNGGWRVDLEPLPTGGPHEITISGTNTLTLKNILVGEVWVCSGQSNMEWPVERSNNPEGEIAAANYPQIRLYTAQRTIASKPRSDVEGGWVECSPQTVGGFSAVGYFFGRALHYHLNIPIGLVKTAWGGTPSEAWTSPEKVASEPAFSPLAEYWNGRIGRFDGALDDYRAQLDEWETASNAAEEAGYPFPDKPKFPDDPRVLPHRITGLYNGMIYPLVPLAIRGAIWYQGESNASRAYQYRKIFPAMIESWRAAWGGSDFPFYFVQLANFKEVQAEPGESEWAELREAQTRTLSLPNTGMATIIDIGEANDIHPRNKQDVGWRLGLVALSDAYDWNIYYSGPMYQSMQTDGGAIRVAFDHAAGLKTSDGGPLKGFAVAGEDKEFHWADAAIDGETVVVSSSDVSNPVAVRYAWADNPVCNLTNVSGLPASPFRTDDWPGETADVETPK
jgi:sialate O-acetylesterase